MSEIENKNITEKEEGTSQNETTILNAAEVATAAAQQEPKKKKKKTPIIIAIIVLILVLLFGGILLWQNMKTPSDAEDLENQIKAQLGIMDGMTEAEIQASLGTVIEEGTLRIGINMNPIFMDGASKGDLNIENHPSNHYDMNCVIVCDLDENGKIEKGETLYHSGLLPINRNEPDPKKRGSHIATDVLEVQLPEGNYECTAIFTALNPETGAQVGAANANIVISVLN